MKKCQIWLYGSLVVMLLTIALLSTGSSVLNMALDTDDSIPLGTFITWAGIISLPLCIYWGISEMRNPTTKLNRFLSMLLKISLGLAVLWVPISYLLAGNISFSFAEREHFQGGQSAMRWFWRLSYGIPVTALVALLTYWVSLLFKKKSQPEKDRTKNE